MCNNSERRHDCRLYAKFPSLYNSGFLLCSHTGRHRPPISHPIQRTFYVSKIVFFSRFRNHVSKRWVECIKDVNKHVAPCNNYCVECYKNDREWREHILSRIIPSYVSNGVSLKGFHFFTWNRISREICREEHPCTHATTQYTRNVISVASSTS